MLCPKGYKPKYTSLQTSTSTCTTTSSTSVPAVQATAYGYVSVHVRYAEGVESTTKLADRVDDVGGGAVVMDH